ncbi:MAG: peptidoglycan-binding domain-containing protein [Pseudomonadota bacterium]
MTDNSDKQLPSLEDFSDRLDKARSSAKQLQDKEPGKSFPRQELNSPKTNPQAPLVRQSFCPSIANISYGVLGFFLAITSNFMFFNEGSGSKKFKSIVETAPIEQLQVFAKLGSKRASCALADRQKAADPNFSAFMFFRCNPRASVADLIGDGWAESLDPQAANQIKELAISAPKHTLRDIFFQSIFENDKITIDYILSQEFFELLKNSDASDRTIASGKTAYVSGLFAYGADHDLSAFDLATELGMPGLYEVLSQGHRRIAPLHDVCITSNLALHRAILGGQKEIALHIVDDLKCNYVDPIGPDSVSALALAQNADDRYTRNLLSELYKKDVVLVQTWLSKGGYYSGAIDGDYGPATKSALATYNDNNRHGAELAGFIPFIYVETARGFAAGTWSWGS